MIVYLHQAELEDAGITFGRHAGRAVRHVLFPPDVGADGFLARITAALPDGHGSLELLVINCHGVNVPGRAVGLMFGSSPAPLRIFNATDMAVFQGLAPWWQARNEGVEVHGCQIARGAEGRQVCQALADHAAAAVYAGLMVQSGTVPGAGSLQAFGEYGPAIIEEFVTGRYAGGPDAWGYFEGPVLRFEPGGHAPHDAMADLQARGAWRRGIAPLADMHAIEDWEATHALAGPDVDLDGAHAADHGSGPVSGAAPDREYERLPRHWLR